MSTDCRICRVTCIVVLEYIVVNYDLGRINSLLHYHHHLDHTLFQLFHSNFLLAVVVFFFFDNKNFFSSPSTTHSVIIFGFAFGLKKR